jgi:tetratricopeptide (TPR) repeat protein
MDHPRPDDVRASNSAGDESTTPRNVVPAPTGHRLRNILLIAGCVILALVLIIVLNPADPVVRANALAQNAVKELKKGQTDKAFRDAQEALRLDHNNPEAHFALGCALLEVRQEDDGINELRKTIALAPNFKAAHHALAHALTFNNRDLPGARDELRKVLELDPGNAQVQKELASINQSATTLPQASSEPLAVHAERIQAILQQFTEGERLIKQADEECGVTGYELFVEASKYCNCDPNSALAKYRKGLELDWPDAEGHAHAAVLLSLAGKSSDAEAELKKAITWNPNELEYRSQLADVLKDEGRYDEAENELKTLTPKSSDKTRLLLRLGDLRREAGDRSGALSYYQQACAQPQSSDELEQNARIFACSYVQLGFQASPSKDKSSPSESICDQFHNMFHVLNPPQTMKQAPAKRQGCCCSPGESNMDCFMRCNESALPCD